MDKAHTVKFAAPGHPILPVLAQRYSPYAFADKPVERADLLACLEAARWAASSYNEQPWRYILAERTDEASFKTALSCLLEANQFWAQHAGVLILTLAKRTFSHGGKPNRVALHDIGLAAGNLTAQAESLGLSVHQMAGVDLQKVRLTYKVPEDFEPATAIAIGYAADPESFSVEDLAARDRTPRTRMTLPEWVFGEKFGTPADVVK